MAVARVNEVRDALAARIEAAWIPYATSIVTPATATQRARAGEQDEVITAARWEIKERVHRGRKIYVVRDRLAGRPGTRGEDEQDYGFLVFVAEFYRDQGEPPDEWVDERVEFCEWLLRLLGNPRAGRLLPDSASGGLWPQEAEITVVVDREELDERKLFASMLTLTYREQTDAPVEG